MNEFYTEEGLVICQICQKAFHFITSNHLKLHGISVAEYRQQFPSVPMAKIDFYKTIKSKKHNPIIEELDIFEDINLKCELSENIDNLFKEENKTIKDKNLKEENRIVKDKNPKEENNSFKEDNSLTVLSNKKIPVPIRNTDPMNDKNDIISFLKLYFPNVINNYIIRKNHDDSTVEYQFVSDIADPDEKILFDFPKSFWHNDQLGASSIVRNNILRSYGWKIVIIDESMPKASHVELKLKNLKLI